jgi:hypothetical protein
LDWDTQIQSWRIYNEKCLRGVHMGIPKMADKHIA